MRSVIASYILRLSVTRSLDMLTHFFCAGCCALYLIRNYDATGNAKTVLQIFSSYVIYNHLAAHMYNVGVLRIHTIFLNCFLVEMQRICCI